MRTLLRVAFNKSGLFCQNPRSLAAAATATQGSRRGRGAAASSTESNALIADLRRDSARSFRHCEALCRRPSVADRN